MVCSLAPSSDANALEYFRVETDNTADRCRVYMRRSPASLPNINTYSVS